MTKLLKFIPPTKDKSTLQELKYSQRRRHRNYVTVAELLLFISAKIFDKTFIYKTQFFCNREKNIAIITITLRIFSLSTCCSIKDAYGVIKST